MRVVSSKSRSTCYSRMLADALIPEHNSRFLTADIFQMHFHYEHYYSLIHFVFDGSPTDLGPHRQQAIT